jgi:hypothetical protein
LFIVTYVYFSLSQIELTAGDLAFHHDTFMIGMSSRSSVEDTTHLNTWRVSKDKGKTWTAFNGWVSLGS